MGLPANDLPRLTELVVATLAERGPDGATPNELAALALRTPQVPDALAARLLDPILSADRRLALGDDGRWRLVAAPATATAPDGVLGATYVVTDVETTGTGTDCRIIEIGAVRVVQGELADTFQQLVDPDQPLPPEIVQLTGITGAMLEGQPAIRDVMPRYVEFLGNDVFVAHNAAFDKRFIYGQAERDCGIVLGNPVLCTRNLARRLMPQLTSRSLDSVVGALGITVPDRHRALGDALATGEVLIALLDRLQALGFDRLDHALQGQTAAGFRKLTQSSGDSREP